MTRSGAPAARWWLVVTLLLGGISWPGGPAHALTQCTATSTSLEFGEVAADNHIDTTATVTVECNSFDLIVAGPVRVRMCLHIGDGARGAGIANPRRMTNDVDELEFQIYRDSARTQVWGSSDMPDAPDPLRLDLEYVTVLLVGSGSTQATLYGRVPAQSGLAAGTYTNPFTGGHTRLDYQFNEPLLIIPRPFPDSCTSGGVDGGSINFGFTARATVPDRCTIDATTDLDFGSVPGLIDAPVDQDATITLTCTRRTAWDVGLDNGQNAAGDTRRMQLDGGTSHVTYELFRDPARTLRWGSTPGTDAEPGEGTGFQQQVTVHGRVPAGQAVPAGQYRDTVTVTVTY